MHPSASVRSPGRRNTALAGWVRGLWALLALCLPLQGLAMVKQRIDNAAHVHVAPALPAGMPTLLDVYSLRHGHGAVARNLADGTPAADADASHHAHTAIASHRHDPADATVLSVASPESDTDAAAAGSASKRLLLDVDTPTTRLPPLADGALHGQALSAPVPPPGKPPGERLERPPRAPDQSQP